MRSRRRGVERAQKAPTVAGSKGQERENPAWGTALKLQASIDRLSAMLLLTPRAAVRAGLNLSTSPDGFAELDGDCGEIYGRRNPFDELAAASGKR